MKKLIIALSFIAGTCFSGTSIYNTTERDAAVTGWDVCDTMKAHCTNSVSGVTTGEWTSCTGFEVIADETQGGAVTLSNAVSFVILKTGMYSFGGCVHVQNTTLSRRESVTILTRLTQDGAEMKCSQRGKVVDLNGSGEEVISYNGTANLTAGDVVKLQYYTSDDELVFYSNTAFTNPVAYTLWLTRCGKVKE